MPDFTNGFKGALTSLFVALCLCRREREIDADGNVCMRYFGPKYSMPIMALFGIHITLKAMYGPIPEARFWGSIIGASFTAFCLLISVHFVFYRITLTDMFIERFQWPLKPRRFLLEQMTCIDETADETILHFNDGLPFGLGLILSGREKFVEQLKENWAKQKTGYVRVESSENSPRFLMYADRKPGGKSGR